MKTTVEIADPLLEQAKRLAARESRTLRQLIEEGLRHVVRQRGRSQAFELRDARVNGRGRQAGYLDADWARIRDAAYEGRGG